jgi:Uma2 family endonuclease
MAGESTDHSTINANLTIRLGIQLVGAPCRVFSPNMKVRASPKGLFAYPDAAVVCGEPQYHDKRRDVLINPTVIIEVLSPSTEKYDRGERFLRYQHLTSLTDYLLVTQDAPRIEHYARQPHNKWLYTVITGLTSSLRLPSINCELRLSEVFDRIVFTDAEDATSANSAADAPMAN